MGEAKHRRTQDHGKSQKTLNVERENLLDQLIAIYLENDWVKAGWDANELREVFGMSCTNEELRQKILALR